jgi:branched-chain amino acid transport system substrate-binding protein
MTLLDRRSLLAGSAAAGVMAVAGPRAARADDTPGVTATELKIGCTTSLSGPVSALGTIAKCSDAYFRMLNDRGGIAGRKINFIYYDDAFSPAKTVEQTRRLCPVRQHHRGAEPLSGTARRTMISWRNSRRRSTPAVIDNRENAR